MPPFQSHTPNSLKHKSLTNFSADRLIYASFCAPYFNLAWALSVIAFLGVSRNMYTAIKDYVSSVKDKYSFLKGIGL